MKIFLCVALVFSAVWLGGCGDSTSTNNGPINNAASTADYGGNTFPKKGSSYNFHFDQLDSLGNKVPGSDKDYTATVTLDSQTFMGKTKVYQVVDNGQNNSFTYEHNGDVSLFFDQKVFGAISFLVGNSLNQWYTFPSASHLKGYIIFDEEIDIPFFGKSPLFGRTLYLGEETVTVGSETFTASHCALKINSSIINYVADFWFVGKIGYFVKRTSATTIAIPGIGGNNLNTDEQIMTSYSLLK